MFSWINFFINGLFLACILCRQLEQAVNHAFQNKNVEDLNLVLAKCVTSNRTLAERIVSLKAQLGAKQ
jgi:hypothetical protein